MTSSPIGPASPSGESSSNQCNLIVNYLPHTMSQADIRRLFCRAGTIDACKLIKDKKTGQSLGYAFVRYQSPSNALRAIQAFNGLRLQNKTIKVSIARPRSSRSIGANVYVSGLDRSMTSHDLEQLFSPFGTIVSCRVLCDECTGLSRGVAFVLFNLRSEAEAAISNLNGVVPTGCKLPMRAKLATQPTIPSAPTLTPQLIAIAIPPSATPPVPRVELLPFQLPAVFDAATGLATLISVNHQVTLMATSPDGCRHLANERLTRELVL